MTQLKPEKEQPTAADTDTAAPAVSKDNPCSPEDASANRTQPREVGGRDGLDPTRYGDWEINGRCVDF